MSIRAHSPASVAKGHPWKGCGFKVVMLLDDETFAEVREGAITNGCSFAAQARMLIEVGLETLKEAA